MADTGLPAAGLTDWQCFCGYVNTGLDTTCARCGVTRLESIAQFEQAALAEQQQAAQEQANLAAEQAARELRRAASAGGERVALAFDGPGLELLALMIIVSLLSILTLGFYSFWGQMRLTRWLANHTVLYGRRLNFTGTGLDFFGVAFVNILLCVITAGIYSPWATVNLYRWHMERVYFAEPLPPS